jgi:membrane-bound ClpP family serine protease
VRKVLIGLKGTDSGTINLILIILGLVGLISAFSVFLGVFKISDLTAILNTEKSISADKSASIKQVISETKTSNSISLIVGYVSLALDFIAYKIIEKKKKREQIKQKNHWNWNKLNP